MFLHVVAFDIPYPANYGGVIVVFHQLRALHAKGVKVILHCYQYGDRKAQKALEEYCEAVYYYPRSKGLRHHASFLPYIMVTRNDRKLLSRLKEDSHPILFEGMHTAIPIWNPALRNRKKLIRMHNIEWQYYLGLSRSESVWYRKLFFRLESFRLKRIEPRVIRNADALIALSTIDESYYAATGAKAVRIPPFHPNDQLEVVPGSGEYALFHGKLSVPDNERAVLWLIRTVFSKLAIPFIIAGMDPGSRILQEAGKYDHIRVVGNPSENEMQELIKNAHINLLVSFATAGIKLKLINALYRGRFCLVNDHMVEGTSLSDCCYVRNSASAIRQSVEALMNTPFSEQMLKKRREILLKEYDNRHSAETLIQLFD